MSSEIATPAAAPAAHAVRLDLERYRQVSHALESTQTEVEKLEHTEAFEVFQKQLELLRRRLLNSPQSLRQTFIEDGVQAIVWEFQQPELGASFTKMLWSLLLRRRRHGDHPAALHLGDAAQVQAQVHQCDRRASVRPLSDVQGPVGELAKRQLYPPLCPASGSAQERLRAGDDGLSRLSRARLFAARSRHAGLARSAARQAVRGPALRARRVRRQPQERRLPGRHPYPRHVEPDGPGQAQGGLRAHPGQQPVARRHRPRLPAGDAMPGRLHHLRPADRDRSARMVPTRARAPRPRRGRRALQRRRRLRHARGSAPTSRRSRWSAPVPPA